MPPSSFQTNEKLSEKQEENCKSTVRDYIKGCADEILADLGVEEMRFCLKLMRDNIIERDRKSNQPQQYSENFNSALALKYNKMISEKDEEIGILYVDSNIIKVELLAYYCPVGHCGQKNYFFSILSSTAYMS